MRLTSYGAALGVTGSCHLLEVGDAKFLLDCGIFQGEGQGERNEEPLPFDPKSIDTLIVSHAHLDHIGRIPLLVKEGFRGRIISTRPTYELARISLLDSARILDYDARRANRKRPKGTPPITPLYEEEDVLEALDMWNEYLEYDRAFAVSDELEVTPMDAGHILGSSFLCMTLTEGATKRKMIFSGDLGNVDKPIIRDPFVPPEADIVLLESTYGDRNHQPFSNTRREVIEAINETLARNGNALIPSFALERSQELLYVLYEAWRDGELPKHAHIYLDSPMAIDATRIFTRHPDCYDEETVALASSGGNPFRFDALTYSRHTDESMRINNHSAGAIIIAGSGMLTGGRILHHLRRNLHREECSVIFCGYQATGTLGRKIIEGELQVEILQHIVPVRSQVHTINGFSGHAGQDTLTWWAKHTNAKKILLVHGETRAKEALGTHLAKETRTTDISIMPFGEPVEL